jgi:hypothetical protein
MSGTAQLRLTLLYGITSALTSATRVGEKSRSSNIQKQMLSQVLGISQHGNDTGKITPNVNIASNLREA